MWLTDPTDDKTIQKIDGAIMRNEAVGIGLKRFDCYRVDVMGMPEGELKDKYLRACPAFFFFDPAGQYVKDVSGKKATSLSGFNRLMEYTWDKSFTMSLKAFGKGYKGILDAFDKMDVQQQNVARKRQKLDERPNPAEKARLDKETAELEEMKKQIEEDEKALFDECKLRPDYLPADQAEDQE